ncbi:unnamed protein product [Amaranthus hypochondriacus]
MSCKSFSPKLLLFLFLLSAIPISILITLERAPHSTHVYQYHSTSWLRESATWDDINRRFIVSGIEGGVGEVRVPDDHHHDDILDEITTVKDVDLAGNASVGVSIDRLRNRLLVVVTDLIGNRYSGLAAYDLSSWKRLFLTHLTKPGDEKSMGDDVAIDEEGNAYVTDAKSSKLWKVNVDGKLLSTIRSPLFTFKEWYKNLVALNGIVYHQDGYLLVVHTFSGALYKIDLKDREKVILVKIVKGSLRFGDGLELVSPTRLVVAGNPAGRLVESTDGWKTASVIKSYSGVMHRLATAATMKDGKIYLNHMIGLGYPKRKHIIVEADFLS